MAQCKNCGKKAIFLRLNTRGLCRDCTKTAEAIPDSRTIVVTDNVKWLSIPLRPEDIRKYEIDIKKSIDYDLASNHIKYQGH